MLQALFPRYSITASHHVILLYSAMAVQPGSPAALRKAAKLKKARHEAAKKKVLQKPFVKAAMLFAFKKARRTRRHRWTNRAAA